METTEQKDGVKWLQILIICGTKVYAAHSSIEIGLWKEKIRSENGICCVALVTFKLLANVFKVIFKNLSDGATNIFLVQHHS